MHSDDVDNFVEVVGLRLKSVHAKCLTTPTCSSRMHILDSTVNIVNLQLLPKIWEY